MMIHLIFIDGVEVDLTICEYLFNLMVFVLPLEAGEKIDSDKLFWVEDITEDAIGKYINDKFVKRYRTKLPFITLNQTIDTIFCKFRDIKKFQWYLMNTVNLEDTADLMNRYPEFYEAVHCDASGVPLEDVKAVGMKAANTQVDYIINSDHCLRDSFRTGEAISTKQFKEVQANIGTKPNGKGGAYPVIINSSFITGGLTDPTAMVIESSMGRQAQILAKNNVGFSGNFARLLGLNTMNTRLHDDPNYSCDTKNFIKINVKNKNILNILDKRYFRRSPTGIDHRLDASRDAGLIGQDIYLRSPMTCNSYVRGKGICYKCYGDLAYVNANINVGKIAAEELSSRFTQKLLSAKHLLESMIEKMEWVGPLYNFFEVYMDCLCLKSDVNYNGYFIKIDNLEMDDEYDNIEFNYHITNFGIISPDGTLYDIHTKEADNIYLQPDFADIVTKRFDNAEEGEAVTIPLNELVDMQNIFRVQIKNDELQATMNEIKNIINVKAKTSSYTKDTILEAFIDTNLKGGIKLDSVHYEVIIANQMRSGSSNLEFPDWSIPDNEDYQILTLNTSLMESPYLMTRLLYSKLGKVLITPSTYEVDKASVNDVFAMTNPIKYFNSDPDAVDTDRVIDVDDDTPSNIKKKINPVMIWENPEQYAKWREKQQKNQM